MNKIYRTGAAQADSRLDRWVTYDRGLMKAIAFGSGKGRVVYGKYLGLRAVALIAVNWLVGI
jgi:hypothetical protein